MTLSAAIRSTWGVRLTKIGAVLLFALGWELFPHLGILTSNTFPPLSMTLFTLAPTAPQLAVLPAGQPNQFVFQLQGQPGVPYVIQNSADLLAWNSIATNTLVGSTAWFTNTIKPNVPLLFWRAVWRP